MSVISKLGLDLVQYEKGWSRAVGIAETGSGALGKAVERKLGLNDAFKSFVASVGIDAQKIGESIARMFTGVSKEEEESLKQLEDLSDKVTDANIKNMRAALTEEKRYQLSLRDRDHLLEKMANRQIKSTADLVEQKKDELALAERIADIQEYQAKKAKEEAEETKKFFADRIDLNEKEHDKKLSNLAADKRAAILAKEVKDLESAHANGVFLGDDKEKSISILNKRRADLIEARGDIDKEKRERDDIKVRRDRKLRDVNENRTDLANAVADRGRLSLTELAGFGKFQAGVSTDLASQAGTARDVLDLQKKAEEARLGGRADDAIALLGQADKLKGGLSALTSTERADPFKNLKDALRTSEEELADINKKLTGKFANE